MQNILLLLLATIVVVALACNTTKKGTESPEEEAVEVPNPYAPTLHDIWVLETMNGEALDRTKKRPQLELNPAEGQISGTGGCNQLFGQMTAKGWQISFGSIGTTKMFCRDLMVTEGAFLKALEEVDHYQIKDLKLIMLQGEKPLLVFQKVD